MARVARVDAMDTSTQLCLYHLSDSISAITRTMGGHSMDWKKPLAHHTGIMTSIPGKSITSRLQQELPARPVKIILRGLYLSPRKPQTSCPAP